MYYRTTRKDRLEIALDARNYIIHRFFNDQGEKLLTIVGRKESFILVKEKRKILFVCYFSLVPNIRTLMEIKGMNSKKLNEVIERKYESG